MKYANLKDKTIFDFCDDSRILSEILPVLPRIDNLAPEQRKSAYIEYFKHMPSSNAFCLIDYAEMTNNTSLIGEVESQFADEFRRIFNEL